MVREFLGHPGSVVVLALDDDERVLMLRQYRHPVRAELWELPAGLRDEPGEPAVRTAARELAEEADLVARRWWRLVDFLASPGCSDERVEVFLARDLSPVPAAERHERHAEELDMVPRWVPLDEVVDGDPRASGAQPGRRRRGARGGRRARVGLARPRGRRRRRVKTGRDVRPDRGTGRGVGSPPTMGACTRPAGGAGPCCVPRHAAGSWRRCSPAPRSS